MVLHLITTLDKPAVLGEGRTDGRGELRIPVALPCVEEGNAALILQASRGEDRVELRWMVRKPEPGGA